MPQSRNCRCYRTPTFTSVVRAPVDASTAFAFRITRTRALPAIGPANTECRSRSTRHFKSNSPFRCLLEWRSRLAETVVVPAWTNPRDFLWLLVWPVITDRNGSDTAEPRRAGWRRRPTRRCGLTRLRYRSSATCAAASGSSHRAWIAWSASGL